MKNFQALSTINAIPLLHQIHRRPALWQADTYLRDYPQGPFGDTETIFLRFPPASVSELARSARDPHECVWMDAALHLTQVKPIINGLMSLVEGERLGRVMVNKLRPGGRIYPHADTPQHAEYWDRYHAVLQSSPGCNFRCGDEQVYMPPGAVWHFRNELEHEVWNNGACDRIHLIIDVRTYHAPVAGLQPTTPPEYDARSHEALYP
jgi:hypothetical protein